MGFFIFNKSDFIKGIKALRLFTILWAAPECPVLKGFMKYTFRETAGQRDPDRTINQRRPRPQSSTALVSSGEQTGLLFR